MFFSRLSNGSRSSNTRRSIRSSLRASVASEARERVCAYGLMNGGPTTNKRRLQLALGRRPSLLGVNQPLKFAQRKGRTAPAVPLNQAARSVCSFESVWRSHGPDGKAALRARRQRQNSKVDALHAGQHTTRIEQPTACTSAQRWRAVGHQVQSRIRSGMNSNENGPFFPPVRPVHYASVTTLTFPPPTLYIRSRGNAIK